MTRFVPTLTRLDGRDLPAPLAAGYLGAAAADVVTGSAIQADGTVVLAGRFDGTPGGLAPVLLNGATAASPGAVVRLAPDGRRVLGVTRVGATVTDLSADAAGNLYVAAGAGGLLKLPPAATTLVWAKPGSAFRVDAGGDGTVAVLGGSGIGDDGKGFTSAGAVTVYSAAGAVAGTFPTLANRRTYDLAVDPLRQSVYTVGFNQTSGGGLPVQVAYTRSQGYDGAERWKGYDWAGSQLTGANGTENNMADTRGVRVSLGGDGKLYVGFSSAGGNHILRYSPTGLTTPAPVVGGDAYFSFYNTRDEHKTVVGRFDPVTGAAVRLQQLTGRLPSGAGNSLTLTNGGEVKADASGRVYVAGAAAFGLPLTFDPLPAGTYTGGAFLIQLSADFTTRLLVARPVASGVMLTVSTRPAAGAAETQIVVAGSAASGGWVSGGVQAGYGGGTTDGYYLVLGPARPRGGRY